MATLDAPAPVNLVKSIFLCNIFTFFFSATKACLLPFLTIYLKMLGLSATQTGLIMGAKTLVGLVFAPLWARCAVRCGRRRCMMMFSLFVMAVTYMSLTAVPSIDENAFTSHCPGLDGPHPSLPMLPGNQNTDKKLTTVRPPLNFSSVAPEGVTESTNIMKTLTTVEPTGTQSKESKTSTKNQPQITTTEMPITGTKSLATKKPVVISKVQTTTSTTTTTTASVINSKEKTLSEILVDILIEAGVPESELVNKSDDELINIVYTIVADKDGLKAFTEAFKRLPTDEYEKLTEVLDLDSSERRRRDTESGNSTSTTTPKAAGDDSGKAMWSTDAFFERIKEFREHIRSTENQIFLTVMIILMIGESLSCPIEKLADDGWYEFLESIDDIEKYGMQRIWSSFAYILFPLIVTVSVDNTICLFGYKQHPFLLHFYLFGGFLALTFLLAFCYPMASSEKYRYATKVMKGLSVVGCNFRNLMMTMTLLVMGTIYASYHNFLFWVLLDKGSKEVTMGLCLTMAALSEIPMLLFNEKLVKKIGSGGVMCISLLFLSARCLYYSFLPSPWAVLPAEITHAFTHTAMWGAVLGTPVFNTSPALSRSIRSILSSVYFGLGYGLGSIISGAIYDIYGWDILFQAGAVFAIGWFPLMCICMRCCRERDRTDVKYQRLLTSDDASDDSDDYEDDWLERALKDK